MKKLTPKQQAWADYFIESGNKTEAAIKAGYSKATAKEIGYENFTKPHIRQYIDERMTPTEEKRIATGDEVLQFLTRVMKGEEKDQFGLDAALTERIKAGELLGKRHALFKDTADINLPVNITIKRDYGD